MQSLFPKINLTTWDYVTILICSVPAFYLLGAPAIYIWDEAVYANASLDMSMGHSWWVPVQEAYNTKPPLVLWLQAISLKCFPWPEFAIRFPSALSVTGILLLITMALKRWDFSIWTRILVAFFFVCNEGFIRHHIARTGDLDAVMTFFVTGYSLIALDAIHFNRWNKRYTVFFFLMVIAAFYAKSVAGWIMLGPLWFIWILSPLRKVLWSRQFLFGEILTAFCCLFYYLTRQNIQPGFISLAWHSEYLRMFFNVMPWHEHGFGYYFKSFVSLHTYSPWIFFLAGAIGYSIFILKNKALKNHLLKWIILSLGYLILISIPADKLEWYDAPVYPFFALILGVTAGHQIKSFTPLMKWICLTPVIFLFVMKLIFIHHDTQPRHLFEFEGSMLRQIKDTDSIKVFMPVATPEHRLQLDFYRKLILKRNLYEVTVLDSLQQIQADDHLLMNEDNLKKIEEKFSFDTLHAWKNYGVEIRLKEMK